MAFYHKLITNLGALPGAEGVALCSSLAPSNGSSSELSLRGKGTVEDLEAVNRIEISSGYFHVLGIPILRGREFDLRERQESQPVAINQRPDGAQVFPESGPSGQANQTRKGG
jgi:hypothetical protein